MLHLSFLYCHNLLCSRFSYFQKDWARVKWFRCNQVQKTCRCWTLLQTTSYTLGTKDLYRRILVSLDPCFKGTIHEFFERGCPHSTFHNSNHCEYTPSLIVCKVQTAFCFKNNDTRSVIMLKSKYAYFIFFIWGTSLYLTFYLNPGYPTPLCHSLNIKLFKNIIFIFRIKLCSEFYFCCSESCTISLQMRLTGRKWGQPMKPSLDFPGI